MSMKVNFSKPFVGTDKMPLMEKGEPVIIGERLGFLMFNMSTVNDQEINPEKKYVIYKLMRKIQQGGEIEINDEEKQIIKQVACDSFSVGAFGQVMEILGE